MSDQQAMTKAISAIYEAAVSPDEWDTALIAIADALKVKQTAIMMLEDGKLVDGTMPMMDPAHLKIYADIKKSKPDAEFDISPQTVALGRVTGFDDPRSREAFRSSYEYSEWWREHDLGIGALFANLSIGGSRLVQIGIYRPRGNGFSKTDRERFADICGHLIRAGKIEHRLALHDLRTAQEAEDDNGGLFIVDRDYLILNCRDDAARRLADFGAVARKVGEERLVVVNELLKQLIDDAQSPNGSGSSCWLAKHDGERAWIDVIPLSEFAVGSKGWLDLDRPVALVRLTVPHKHVKLRVRGLAREFGLTPAEEAVAVEIVKGDGRAATARRLDISESTVRSHLSVIFEKVGIHRQSELIQLLAS